MPTHRIPCMLAVCSLALGFLASCNSTPIGTPTPEEIQERDYWANRLAPSVREEVLEDARRHTNWAERRQVQWETERYHHIVLDTQARMHKINPTTNAAPLDY